MTLSTFLRRSLFLLVALIALLGAGLLLAAHSRNESISDWLAREVHCVMAFTPDALGGKGRALCRAGFPVSPTGTLSTDPSAERR